MIGNGNGPGGCAWVSNEIRIFWILKEHSDHLEMQIYHPRIVENKDHDTQDDNKRGNIAKTYVGERPLYLEQDCRLCQMIDEHDIWGQMRRKESERKRIGA
jgi:hypothetical protein